MTTRRKRGSQDASSPYPTTASAATAAKNQSESKWQNWWVRFTWTAFMIAAAFVILMSGKIGILSPTHPVHPVHQYPPTHLPHSHQGHFWVILLVVGIQIQVFKEVINIAHVPSKEKKLPFFGFINWYFLLSTNYFLYGESIIHYFKQIGRGQQWEPWSMNLPTHPFLSFSLI